MKNILTLIIFVLLAVGCVNQGSKNQIPSEQNAAVIAPENLQTIKISVYGMSCEGCERTIQAAVGKLSGIQEVKASHLDSTVVVKFDKTQSSFDEMKAAITNKGYVVNDFKNIIE